VYLVGIEPPTSSMPHASLGERSQKSRALRASHTQFELTKRELVDLVEIEPPTSSMPHASLGERSQKSRALCASLHNLD